MVSLDCLFPLLVNDEIAHVDLDREIVLPVVREEPVEVGHVEQQTI